MLRHYYIIICLLIFSCKEKIETRGVSIVILGTVQDGGSPHIGCDKDCCKDLFENPDKNRMVVSLGLFDTLQKKSWLFEATPDISRQVKMLKRFSKTEHEMPDGIFLTHAHIGHYSGLMYLGREAINSKKVPVFAMPRMKTFLEENGPWNQLVKLENIILNALQKDSEIKVASNIKVTPIQVPHRDEYSETVGYIIQGPNKKVLFIPDIDKWSKWSTDIVSMIREVDYAVVDGTFYDGKELPNRNISEIPHPFVIESMEQFKNLPPEQKDKIYFIHFNHTNPLLNVESDAYKTVTKNGFHIAQTGAVISL